jgi:hypothetical protein
MLFHSLTDYIRTDLIMTGRTSPPPYTIPLSMADIPEHASPCTFCTDAASNVCNGCKNIRYCSASCQTADWPIHKLVCKKFKDFAESPTLRNIRTVFFPEDAPRPRFVWLRLKHRPDGTMDTTNLMSELALAGVQLTDHPHDLRVSNKRFLTFDGILRRVIDPIIVVSNLDNNDEMRSTTGEPSRSIKTVDNELSAFIPGHLLFIGYKNRNLDTKDFRYIIDHMSTLLYRAHNVAGLNSTRRKPLKV